jgi:hypothetical protein
MGVLDWLLAPAASGRPSSIQLKSWLPWPERAGRRTVAPGRAPGTPTADCPGLAPPPGVVSTRQRGRHPWFFGRAVAPVQACPKPASTKRAPRTDRTGSSSSCAVFAGALEAEAGHAGRRCAIAVSQVDTVDRNASTEPNAAGSRALKRSTWDRNMGSSSWPCVTVSNHHGVLGSSDAAPSYRRPCGSADPGRAIASDVQRARSSGLALVLLLGG